MLKNRASLKSNLIGDKAFYRRVLSVAIPIIIQNGISNFVNLLDNIMVGQVGTIPMSGVAIVNQLLFVFNLCVFGAASGAGIFTAQFCGSRDHEGIRHTFRFKIMVGLLLAALGIGIFLTAGTPLIQLYLTGEGSPEDVAQTLHYGLRYLHIMLIGLVPFALSNAYSGTLRETGQTVVPMAAGICAVLVNLAFNYILIFGKFGAPAMGVEGAAWATVIAQAVSFLIAAFYLSKSRFVFDFRLRSFRIVKDKMKMMIKLGIPSSVQSIIVNISFLVMSAVVNTIGGVVASAAVGIVGKFNSFAILPAVAMSNSVSAYAAQNIGAGFHDRARKCLNVGIAIALSISAVILAAVQLFPETIIGFFDSNADTIRDGVAYIRTFSIEYLFIPILFCINGLIMGAGHTFFTLISGALSSLLLRIPVAIIFGSVLGWGLPGVGLAGPAATLFSVLFAGWFLLSGRWLKDKTGIRREEGMG
mgnify:CR=1 FL=1